MFKSVKPDMRAIHMAHCFQDEYEGSCKYGDADCPAAKSAAMDALIADSADMIDAPDYLDDAEGLGRWRDEARRGHGHDMASVNINSLRRLIDTIDRLSAALASGHTPSPCPGCAAKDEVMEAFKAQVSAGVTETLHIASQVEVSLGSAVLTRIRNRLSRFIIPPTDPVAEALKAAETALHELESYSPLKGIPPRTQIIRAALAELKSRLPLGGAK